jgi:hypothetical protein
MKSFTEFVLTKSITEDSKGHMTKEGDSLISKFVTIKDISKIITTEMTSFDQDRFDTNHIQPSKAKIVWNWRVLKDSIEIVFQAEVKLLIINGIFEDDNNVYSGTIIVNPVSNEITSKIEVK